jgi:hypothetical protein
MGDAVCVPVISYLAEHMIIPYIVGDCQIDFGTLQRSSHRREMIEKSQAEDVPVIMNVLEEVKAEKRTNIHHRRPEQLFLAPHR